MQAEFEREFQAFVERGGLDEVRVINEAYELMRRHYTCPHGELRSNCGICSGGIRIRDMQA